MKKLLLVIFTLFVSVSAMAQNSSNYVAQSDCSEFNISRGDIWTITFDGGRIIFESLVKSSFVAIPDGGMAGTRDGYHFAFYRIGNINNVEIKKKLQQRYESTPSDVIIRNCRLKRYN